MKKINLVMSAYKDEYLFENFKNMVDHDNTDIFFYKKNDDLEIGEKVYKDGFIEIANYGSCDYAFLKHIVDNYDNLSEFTIFTKLNWKFTNNNLFTECTNYDFYQCGSYHVSQIYFDSKKHKLTKELSFTHTNVDIHDIHLVKRNRGDDFNYAGNADNKSDWFEMIFGDLEEITEVQTFGQGPVFSVSRELIRRHKKETYEYLLHMHEPFNSWSREKATEFWKNYDQPHDFIKKLISEGVDLDSTLFQSVANGRYYHEELCRFYTTLFTYGIDRQKFKTNTPAEKIHKTKS